MKNKNKHNRLKKLYFKFKDYENGIEQISSFLLILAFIITLPYLAELQIAWLASLIVFAVAINLTIKSMERVHPEIKIEYEQDQFKKEIYDEIKDIRMEVKKLKDETKEQKKQ